MIFLCFSPGSSLPGSGWSPQEGGLAGGAEERPRDVWSHSLAGQNEETKRPFMDF